MKRFYVVLGVIALAAVAFIAYLLVLLLRDSQQLDFPAARILLIVRTHLFVRRPIAAMLDPSWTPPPRNVAPSTQMSLPLCN